MILELVTRFLRKKEKTAYDVTVIMILTGSSSSSSKPFRNGPAVAISYDYWRVLRLLSNVKTRFESTFSVLREQQTEQNR